MTRRNRRSSGSASKHIRYDTDAGMIKRVERHEHAKFCQNRSQFGRDMAIFFIFQDGGRRPVGFLKFQIFNGMKSQECRTASLCHISCKSLEMRLRYGYVLIFQDGSRRHLGFSKFQVYDTVRVGLLQSTSGMTDAVERTMIAAFEKTYFTYFSHFKKTSSHFTFFEMVYQKVISKSLVPLLQNTLLADVR